MGESAVKSGGVSEGHSAAGYRVGNRRWAVEWLGSKKGSCQGTFFMAALRVFLFLSRVVARESGLVVDGLIINRLQVI